MGSSTDRSRWTVLYPWVIVAVVWLSGAIYFLNYMTIGTLAPFMKPDLQLSSAQIGLLCSAVTIGSMIAQIPAGIVCDLFSPGRIIALGLGIIGVSALAVSSAHSYLGSFSLLVFLGLGVGCNQAPASKAVVLWFPSKGRATAMGVKQTGIAVGGFFASILLPALAVFNDWRFAFQGAGLASLISAAVVFFLYKNPSPNPGSGQTRLFRKEFIFRLVWDRDFLLICLTGILLMIVQYSFSTYFILYCHDVLGMPVQRSGFLLALSFASGAFGRVGWSLLSDFVFGARRKIVVVLIGITGALASAAFIPLGAWDLPYAVYAAAAVFGFVGLGWNAIYLTIAAEFPGSELAGTATGMVFLISNLGVIVGPPFFGYLIDATGSYHWSWLFLTLCMTLVAVSSKIRKKETL